MDLIDINTDHHISDGELDDIDETCIHKMANGDMINPKGPHQLNTFENSGFNDFEIEELEKNIYRL